MGWRLVLAVALGMCLLGCRVRQEGWILTEIGDPCPPDALRCVSLLQRVERIERHLGLPPLEP